LPNPIPPIVIGILGARIPFGAIIDQIVRIKKIGGRGFVVKRLKVGGGSQGSEGVQDQFLLARQKEYTSIELVQIVARPCRS